jgi:hypothetical protein
MLLAFGTFRAILRVEAKRRNRDSAKAKANHGCSVPSGPVFPEVPIVVPTRVFFLLPELLAAFIS